VCFGSILIAGAALVFLLGSIVNNGIGRLGLSLFTNFGSYKPEQAGIKAALFGTVWIVVLTTLIAVPVGVSAAIYLEEFVRRKNRFADFIELNIANLAGVPSIVYGLLGLALFVHWLEIGRSILAGALTMSLLILPTIIIATREALRAVPSSFREGSVALGASDWQTIRRQVLPAATPGIITGIILSASRAMGETAPLVTIGAVSYIKFVPQRLGDKFTVLPMQIYEWSSRPQEEFRHAAAAAIIVLIATLLVLNSLAIWLRARARKKIGV
jgi:phosphate transport system permease protein